MNLWIRGWSIEGVMAGGHWHLACSKSVRDPRVRRQVYAFYVGYSSRVNEPKTVSKSSKRMQTAKLEIPSTSRCVSSRAFARSLWLSLHRIVRKPVSERPLHSPSNSSRRNAETIKYFFFKYATTYKYPYLINS